MKWYRNNNRIEGIGLILLLIAFGWQAFEEEVNSLSNDVYRYQIHQKLDAIWMVTRDLYSQGTLNKTDVYTSANFKMLVENEKSWYQLKSGLDSVNLPGNIAKVGRIMLYIIGSIFLVLPKFSSKEN